MKSVYSWFSAICAAFFQLHSSFISAVHASDVSAKPESKPPAPYH